MRCKWMCWLGMLMVGMLTVKVGYATTVYVDPDTVYAGVGDTFNIDIDINNVVNLAGYEFKLGYDPNVINADTIIIGEFLLPNYFLWYYLIDNNLGLAWYAVTQSFSEPGGVDGNGRLAIIGFTVVNTGETPLDLYDTKLGTPEGNPIPHDVVDGYFKALPSGIESFLVNQEDYSLQIYPNPFRQKTVISYQLPLRSIVSLKIYDLSGRLIRTLVDSPEIPGSYTVEWDGSDNTGRKVINGIYFCRLKAGDSVATKKLTGL